MPTQEQVMEALGLLQEECAEIIQIISKIRRFGFNSYSPVDPKMVTNYQLLNDEVGDFETLKTYLINANILDQSLLLARMRFKSEKLKGTSNIYNGDAKCL